MRYNKKYLKIENGIIEPVYKNGYYDRVYYGCAIMSYIFSNYKQLDKISFVYDKYIVTVPMQSLIPEKTYHTRENGTKYSVDFIYWRDGDYKKGGLFDEFIMDSDSGWMDDNNGDVENYWFSHLQGLIEYKKHE